jgi:hypothetical protein
MYATVRSYTDPSLAAALAARGDEIRAVIGEVPGFRAYYLVEASSGTVSVTVCDDQAGAEESNRVAADWLKSNMPELGTGAAPTVSAGPVVLDA